MQYGSNLAFMRRLTERWRSGLDEMSRGGIFAALEAPELLSADVTTFFRSLRGR